MLTPPKLAPWSHSLPPILYIVYRIPISSYSKAPLYLYALRMISNHSEGTIGRLRYFLGGDRPSQTAHQTLSLNQIMVLG